MKYTYLFVLGRYSELSTREIQSVLHRLAISYQITLTTETYLILESMTELDVRSLNQILGGTVKIGILLTAMSKSYTQEQLEEYVTSDALFVDIFPNPQEKIVFGISKYSNKKTDTKKRPPQMILNLVSTLKRHLESQGFSVKFPRHDTQALSSASVEKNKLLSQGAEILLIETPDSLLIGKTLVVQEFESFSNRDYGRPVRDMESGIMPPKLARMMINITEKPLTATLLDPFCGSGTILQEALLLGYEHLTGTDLSPKAVNDTKHNLSWLRKTHDITPNPKVFIADVTSLSHNLPQGSIDAIVTEPYMGPNFQERPSLQLLEKNREELSLLYLNAWKEYYPLLSDGGVVVMVLPVFHLHNQYLYMNILDEIKALGFDQIPLQERKRDTLLIGNNKDYVLREIVKFVKKG